jgi:hypothetical protein
MKDVARRLSLHARMRNVRDCVFSAVDMDEIALRDAEVIIGEIRRVPALIAADRLSEAERLIISGWRALVRHRKPRVEVA